MKKAYVKTKSKSVKSILGRSYIVATVLGAALCAMILSFVLKPYTEPENDEIQVTEIDSVKIAEVIEPQPEPVEYEPLPEVAPTEPPEILEIKEPDEAEQAGTFTKKEPQLRLPVDGKITNQYSDSKPVKNETTGVWQTHNGIDISSPEGTTVCAPCDGVVVDASQNELYQCTVTIDHSNGYVSTVYNLKNLSVKAGDKVKSGDKIGEVGSGAAIEADESAHVHLEIKKNGKFTDPNQYLK